MGHLQYYNLRREFSPRRVYFDISFFCGLVDPKCGKSSKLVLEEILLGEVICVYSNLTEKELCNAPNDVNNIFKSLPEKSKERILITPQIYKLAQYYIKEQVVGGPGITSCIHIAAASLNNVEILISWMPERDYTRQLGILDYVTINDILSHPHVSIYTPNDIYDLYT